MAHQMRRVRGISRCADGRGGEVLPCCGTAEGQHGARMESVEQRALTKIFIGEPAHRGRSRGRFSLRRHCHPRLFHHLVHSAIDIASLRAISTICRSLRAHIAARPSNRRRRSPCLII